MFGRASSLRRWPARRVTVVAACLGAVTILPGVAVAARGAPLPAPDDPPPTLLQSKAAGGGAAGPVTLTKTERTTAPAATPTPDVPPGASSGPEAQTDEKRAPARPAPAPRVSTAVSGTAYVPPVRTVPRSASTGAPKQASRKKPAEPTSKRRAPKTNAVQAVARSVPRDSARAGLPIGTLRALPPERALQPALLVAAGLLLAAAAAGGLVVGTAADRLARSA